MALARSLSPPGRSRPGVWRSPRRPLVFLRTLPPLRTTRTEAASSAPLATRTPSRTAAQGHGFISRVCKVQLDSWHLSINPSGDPLSHSQMELGRSRTINLSQGVTCSRLTTRPSCSLSSGTFDCKRLGFADGQRRKRRGGCEW